MRVHLPIAKPRIAFWGDPCFELHALKTCDWAETRFFAARPGGLVATADEIASWRPDFTLAFEPASLGNSAAARVPGIKIGVFTSPMCGADAARKRRELLPKPGQPCGFSWFTSIEETQAGELSGLPVLQALPLPVDLAHFPDRLDLEALGIAAIPSIPPQILEQVRKLAPIEILTPGTHLPSALVQHGILLHWSDEPLGTQDDLPLLALASGLLLLSNQEFPASWGIEPEDEYLCRPSADLWVHALDEALRVPQSMRAVRMRGWQRIRESFAASPAYKRLVHDALLFSPSPA